MPRTFADGSTVERLCEAGLLTEARNALLRMNLDGQLPSVHALNSFLQACGKTRALFEVKQVHALIVELGLESIRLLSESLICTLVKCGCLEDATEVFKESPKPSVFSCTVLIAGYTKSGEALKAVKLYHQMLLSGLNPNTYTFVSVLKACGTLADVEEGKQIHARATRDGCDLDLFVGTALVDMYAKCGSMEDAQCVFDSLPYQDVTLWTAMISGYAQQEQEEKALQLYAKMHFTHARPDAWTFASVLKVCSGLAAKEESLQVAGKFVKPKSLCLGKALHAEVARRGLEGNAFLKDTFLCMYAKCGSTDDAEHVLYTLPQSTVVSWTAMVGGYVGQIDKVLEIYARMQVAGVSPDLKVLVSILKECVNLACSEGITLIHGQGVKPRSLYLGKVLHSEAVNRGYQSNLFLGNTLMHMYAACGSVQDAYHVFDRLEKDVVSWNVLIRASAHQEEGKRALELYEQMQQACVNPDIWTFVSVLKACGNLSESEGTAQMNGQSVRPELLGLVRTLDAEISCRGLKSDVFICNALVVTYARCGSIMDAEYVFRNMAIRNVVSWSAMIAGYAQHEQGEKALELYARMREECVHPDEAAFLSILKACSSMGVLHVCSRIHRDISDRRQGCWTSRVTTALLDAYCKCGSMDNAQKLFDELPQPDVVSWSALIAGYAREGEHMMCLNCFEDMRKSGTKPNEVTFLSVLHACSHAGMVDRGLSYFKCMERDYCITPTVEHYACVVDLYGRSGLLVKAADFVEQMPMRPSLAVWLSLLGACRKYGNVDLARRAFEHAIQEKPTEWSAYLVMISIYANSGQGGETEEIEDLSMRAGSWKEEHG